MKKTLLILAAALLCASMASGSSFGFNLRDADLVVAGFLYEERSFDDHLKFYRLDSPEVVAGELPPGAFGIVRPCHICYHADLADGDRMLLFLRKVEGHLSGHFPGPIYMALAADLAAVPLVGEEGGLIMQAARTQVEIMGADAGVRARAMSDILAGALEPGRPLLLQSALVDAIRTPGAIERLDELDKARMLEQFRRAAPHRALKRCLLDGLGRARPEGLSAELVDAVRGPAGAFHRDQIAAILADVGGETVPGELIRDFEKLDRSRRDNVLYVLGHLGKGKGVDAICSVAGLRVAGLGAAGQQDACSRLEGVQTAAVDALFADRSPEAVEALGELAAGAWSARDAAAAVVRLGRINSARARALLSGVRDNVDLDPGVRQKAAEFLNRLSR
jgi:hypothetical protein